MQDEQQLINAIRQLDSSLQDLCFSQERVQGSMRQIADRRRALDRQRNA